ncbi:hypothetical protein GQ53DRAFT_717156 [Thozetella sp. PMI_491]|nr:hypothetical protein GQ53DRAFT_717156 [Thozetella sp. PMI_491]
MATSLTAGRPPTACRQCKRQKVRCSGGLPSCERCLGSNASCAYPQGTSSQKRRLCTRPQSSQRGLSPLRSIVQGNLPPLTISLNNNPLTILQGPDYLGIPESLISDLIDTFFSHHYNARLLLHKSKFQEERARRTIRPHVLLSICAMGAVFHRDEKDRLPFKDFAQVWAERAGKLALNEVETPREDNIVTFATLSLFWYTQGSWRRSYIHKGNAMQTAHILKLVNNKGEGRTSLEAELSRRRFWACYLINCHSTDCMFSISPPKKLAALPLPCEESEFDSGVIESPLVAFGSESTNCGIYSEMVKAMTHWTSVNSLVKTFEPNPQTQVTAIHQLDAEIRKWWSQVPQGLRLTPMTLATFHRVDLTKVLLINIVYQQCLCALHSSIVPLFSWGPEEPTQTLAQQLSAQLAYDSACSTSHLLKMMLDYYPDVSDFPSFIGYAAYCSYAVQIPFKWCLNSSVRETAEANTRVNLEVIQNMSQYWKFIALLANYAQYLTEMHAQNQLALDDQPKGLSPSKLSGFRITAAGARSSILSMNGILWKDDGYTMQGDEVQDLGLTGSDNMHSESPSSTRVNRPVFANDGERMSFTDREASSTTLFEGGQAMTSGIPPLYGDQRHLDFFQPLLYASEMLEPMPDNFGFIEVAGVDAAPSWPRPASGENAYEI